MHGINNENFKLDVELEEKVDRIISSLFEKDDSRGEELDDMMDDFIRESCKSDDYFLKISREYLGINLDENLWNKASVESKNILIINFSYRVIRYYVEEEYPDIYGRIIRFE